MGKTLERCAQAAENNVDDGKASKGAMLAELVSDTSTCDAVGTAWRLFFRLLLVERGVIRGTYEAIGGMMGVNQRTVRNWANGLHAAGIVRRESKGREVELRLADRFMAIARMPERETRETVDDPLASSPRMRALRRTLEAAEEAGSKLEVKVVV